MSSNIESAANIDLDEQDNVAVLLAQLEEEALTLGKKKALDIQFTVAENLNVLGNEMQLRSATANLVHNAVKYTPDNGTVKVEWSVCEQGGYFGWGGSWFVDSETCINALR